MRFEGVSWPADLGLGYAPMRWGHYHRDSTATMVLETSGLIGLQAKVRAWSRTA